jgi:hypothetical protein
MSRIQVFKTEHNASTWTEKHEFKLSERRAGGALTIKAAPTPGIPRPLEA